MAVEVGLLGIPLAILLTLQWRALADFELSTIQVLQQMSAHTAEALAQQIQRDFKAPVFNLLEQVDHNAVREMRLAEIGRTLREREPHARFLDLFFVWSREPPFRLTRDPAEDVRFARLRHGDAAAGASANAGVSPDAVFFSDPALSSAIFRNARDFAAIRSNFALADQEVGGRRRELVYHFLYNLPERRSLNAFLGFSIDRQQLCERYFPELVTRLGLAGRQLRGFPPLEISIVDDEGREVFRTGPPLVGRYEHEVAFPFFFYDIDIVPSLSPFKPDVRYWTVRTGFGERSVAELVHAATFAQRALWVGVGLAAFAGLLLTARATVRELRLAQMKSDFVSSVSHELKTPLALIQLFADTLESGRVRSREKAQEYYRIISSEAGKLTRQIGGLIEFARIEAGIRHYPLEEVDLRALVQSAVATFQPHLEEQQFETVLDLPDDEVPVRGDYEGLQRVVGNLVSNAIKYSNGSRYLRVALARDGGEAIIEVTDRGIGIPGREQARIFRPFERAVRAGATAVPGSGLGLAIVAHAVKAHGGHIEVISAVGQGSTFRVRLPISETPEAVT